MAVSLPADVGSLADLFTWTNELMGGWLGLGLLFSLFIIVFATALQRVESAHAFTTAMLTVFVLGLFFRILGIIDPFVFFMIILLTAAAVWGSTRAPSL